MWPFSRRETWALAPLVMSVVACSFIPPLPKLGDEAGTTFKRASTPAAGSTSALTTPVGSGSAASWTVLQDPVLERLQHQLLQSNLSLASATVQVRRAQAALATAQASLWPSVNLNTGVTRSANQLGAAPGTSYSLSAPVSWEVQLWGRVDALSTVARAGVQASQEDLAAARLSLQATLVSTYVGLYGRAARAGVASSRSRATTLTRSHAGPLSSGGGVCHGRGASAVAMEVHASATHRGGHAARAVGTRSGGAAWASPLCFADRPFAQRGRLAAGRF